MPQVKQRQSPVSFERRPASLAVCIADLTRIEPVILEMLLAGRLEPAAKPVRMDPDRPDEAAVELTCDLLTAATVIDIIRDHDRRAGDHPCRAWLRRDRSWVKLPGAAVLTLTVDGRMILNPEWFPEG